MASLTRADSSVLTFTGKRVSIRKLFVAKDANGVVIPDARISCVTPAGFTLTGDSLVSPLSEARGKLRCSATTVPASALVSAQLVADADSLTVTAGIDLRLFTWRAAWRCTGGGEFVSWEPNGVVVGRADSAEWSGRATYVYAGEAGYVSNYAGADVAQMAVGRYLLTLYRAGAVVYSDSVTTGAAVSVQRQAPDTLFWYNPGQGFVGLTPAPRAAGLLLRRYVGGHWCPPGLAPLGPAVLEEMTP